MIVLVVTLFFCLISFENVLQKLIENLRLHHCVLRTFYVAHCSIWELTEDDFFTSFLGKTDFFRSLTRIWIKTHSFNQNHHVNLFQVTVEFICGLAYAMKNRQKVKSRYQEYLSKSDGNTNIVFKEKFLALFGNI